MPPSSCVACVVPTSVALLRRQVMVSAVISAACFGEIRGQWNIVGFAIALFLQLVGVLMLAAGS